MIIPIPSAYTSHELGWLHEVAANKIVLDLLPGEGASTVAMAQPGTRVCTVAWPFGRGVLLGNLWGHGCTLVSEHSNEPDHDLTRLADNWGDKRDEMTTVRHKSQRKIVCCHFGTPSQIIKAMDPIFDLIVIGGEPRATKLTLELVAPKVRADGKIVVSNYGVGDTESGVAALGWWEMERRVDDLAVLHKFQATDEWLKAYR